MGCLPEYVISLKILSVLIKRVVTISKNSELFVYIILQYPEVATEGVL